MDMFYKKLSLYLSENKNISKDDEELYEYIVVQLSRQKSKLFIMN